MFRRVFGGKNDKILRQQEEALQWARKEQERQERAHREEMETERRKRDALARKYEEEQRKRDAEAQRLALAKQEHENRRREREQREKWVRRQGSPETLRNLRDLIRKRYMLDVKIHQRRNVFRADRPIVEDMMVQSDAILREILKIVGEWSQLEGQWTDEEREKAALVKSRLEAGGKRWWADNPPWDGERRRQF